MKKCNQPAARTLRAIPRLMLCGAVAAGASIATAAPPAVVPGDGIVGYVKGRVLVKARAGLSMTELDKELKAHGGRRVEHLKQLDIHVIELPGNANEQAIAKLLAKNPRFKFAELDLVVQPNLTTNDPATGSAWHLAKVGAPSAWDYSVGKSVTIAILDTGVNGAHPDLAANIVPGWNVFDNNNNTADVYGHGTAVAGVAAGVGNNLIGAAGLAWQSRIMPVRVSALDGTASYSNMAKGITWAADQGARVANLSYQSVAGSATISSAASYLRNKGGVLVVCAGNSGTQLSFPTDANITAVSSTNSDDTFSSFSSFGTFVDIAAPGNGIYTTDSGGGYSTWAGTSFSSPVVAGVYALMIASNPLLTPASLDTAILSTARDLGTAGKDSYFGAGRVDASRAVTTARAMVASDTTAPSVGITSPGAAVVLAGIANVDVYAADPSGVASVDVYANNKLIATDVASPYQFAIDTTTLPDGATVLTAKAKDSVGNVGTSAAVNVTIANDTVAPTVSITSPTAAALVTGTVTVTATATDNKSVSKMSLLIDGREVAVSYGGSLSYAWSTGTTTTRTARKGKTTTTTTTTTASIQVRAQDAAGNTGSASVTVTRN
jgi:thermitase